MVKIETIDKKVIIEKYENDVIYYQRTVKDVTNKLANSRLEKSENGWLYKILQSDKEFAEFIPYFSGEEKALSELTVKVYNELTLNHIKQAINNHLDKCSSLKKVVINTYF